MSQFPGLLFWANAGLVGLGLIALLWTRFPDYTGVAVVLLLGLPLAGPWEETGHWLAVGLMALVVLRAIATGHTAWTKALQLPMMATGAWLAWGLLSALGSMATGASLMHSGSLTVLVVGGLTCGWLLAQSQQHWSAWALMGGLGMAMLAMRALLRLHQYYKSATMPFWLDANFFSAGLALLLPLLLGVALSLQHAHLRWRRVLQVLAVVLAIFFGIAILFLQSRGAWVSLLAAGAMLPFLLLRQAKQRWSWLLGLMLLAGVLVAFWPRAEASTRTVLGRAESIANPNEFSNRERLMRWTCAWRMALDRPILGHGSGQYPVTFKHYLRDEGEARQIAAWFGWRFGAHSDGFTALAETGWVGLFLFLGMLGTWGWVLVRSQLAGTKDRLGSALGIASLLTWVVHGFFNDMLDNACLTVWFFVVLGALGSRMVAHAHGYATAQHEV